MMKKWLVSILFVTASYAFSTPLSFNWKQNKAEVTEITDIPYGVTETNDVSSDVIEYRYFIQLTKRGISNFVLSYGNRNIISINDYKPSEEAVLSSQALPPLILLINQSGQAVDILNWKDFYTQSKKISLEKKSISKDDLEELNNLEIQNAIKQKKMDNPWGYWIWLWADINPDKLPAPSQKNFSILGIPYIQTSSYELINQTDQEITLRYQSQVNMDQTADISNESFLKADKVTTKELIDADQLFKSVTVTATLAKQTMQPKSVEVSEVSSFPFIKIKRTTYRFKWFN
ncbi:hypothetical protein [Neisseria flavescens]|jgi:hypothetical protein|uniref:hypothetical protein n=1 Tax=Neisseria flavescens TaxID=484 RepID=UPI0012B80877|nr:hypothetical protein [Neisseria flavescens]